MALALSKLLSSVVAMDRSPAPHALPDVCDFTVFGATGDLAEPGARSSSSPPAEASGGAAFLQSVASPVPAVRFCPTGGIIAASAPAYLALPNVGWVGGSWLTPADALAGGDRARVTPLAAEAAGLH